MVDDRNYALYRLALYSGMRRGELLGLAWPDIRWDAEVVAVQTQLSGEDDPDLDGAPTKSDAGRRSIRLDAESMAVLRDHREAQGFERKREGYQDRGLVFCRVDGRPHAPDTISGQFERLIKRADLPRIRFHDQRHTYATLALEAGVDIVTVSERLGHASINTTAKRYAHVTSRLQEMAAERFAAYVAV